jgi:MFS family permease
MTDAAQALPVPGRSVWWLAGAIAAGVVIPAAIGAVTALAAYYPVGQVLPASSLFILTGTVGLVVLAAVVMVLAGIFYSIWVGSWRPVVLSAIVGIVMIPSVLLAMTSHSALRVPAFHLLAARSVPLVQAIETYEHEKGAPPGALDDLVPEYLAEVPRTGMSAYPTYEYAPGPGYYCSDNTSWNISILVGDVLNWDMFFYCPGQDYPAKAGGDPVEVIGAWAYLHE